MTNVFVLAYLAVGLLMVALTWRHMFDDEGLDGDFTVSYVTWTLLLWPLTLAVLAYVKFFMKGDEADRSSS